MIIIFLTVDYNDEMHFVDFLTFNYFLIVIKIYIAVSNTQIQILIRKNVKFYE